MGIYGLTWSLTPLGGLQAGLVANGLGAPFAIAMGGLIIVGFAIYAAVSKGTARSLATLVIRNLNQ